MNSRAIAAAGAAILLLTACESPDRGLTGPDPQSASVVPQASVPGAKPVKEVWISDFLALNPGQYGIKTYQTGDGRITSRILGTETVPYLTGPITGVKASFGDSYSVNQESDRYFRMLGYDGWYMSTTCGALTAYPPSAVIGKVHDGMILDMTGGETIWMVNGDDPTQCREINTGDGDSYVGLIQIQDIRLPDTHVPGKWHVYKDALFFWALEPNGPPAQFPLEFGGVEDLLGIELPTAEDANHWAVDEFQVWGRNKGVLLMGNIELATGELHGVTYLVAEPMATGGGTVDWTETIRVTYGFNAKLHADGAVRGQIQFNWHDTENVWHGDLDCLAVDGNRAYMSGRILNGEAAGRYLVFGVEDNGEGADAPRPDRISLVHWGPYPYDCTTDGPALARGWTNGNVQIR